MNIEHLQNIPTDQVDSQRKRARNAFLHNTGWMVIKTGPTFVEGKTPRARQLLACVKTMPPQTKFAFLVALIQYCAARENPMTEKSDNNDPHIAYFSVRIPKMEKC